MRRHGFDEFEIEQYILRMEYMERSKSSEAALYAAMLAQQQKVPLPSPLLSRLIPSSSRELTKRRRKTRRTSPGTLRAPATVSIPPPPPSPSPPPRLKLTPRPLRLPRARTSS